MSRKKNIKVQKKASQKAKTLRKGKARQAIVQPPKR
jgi:hypothetical protein